MIRHLRWIFIWVSQLGFSQAPSAGKSRWVLGFEQPFNSSANTSANLDIRLIAPAPASPEKIIFAGTFSQSESQKAKLGAIEFSSRENSAAYVARTNPAGKIDFVRVFESNAFLNLVGLTVAVDSSIAVFGSYSGRLSIGNQKTSSNGAEPDIFLAKLKPTGELEWLKTYGGAGSDWAHAMIRDRSGNLVIAGSFEGGEPGFGRAPLPVFGAADIFVTKISAAGQTLWSRSFGGNQMDRPLALTSDDEDRIALLGQYFQRIHLEDSVLETPDSDVFVSLLSPSGKIQWNRSLNTKYTQKGLGLHMEKDAVGIALTFAGELELVGQKTESALGGIAVFKLSILDGSPQWINAYATDTPPQRNDESFPINNVDGRENSELAPTLAGLAFDKKEDLIIAGELAHPADLGGGRHQGRPENGKDIFLARYKSRNGHFTWSRRLDGKGDERVGAFALGSSGTMYIAGTTTFPLQADDHEISPGYGTQIPFIVSFEP
jgi:hypothetical protein